MTSAFTVEAKRLSEMAESMGVAPEGSTNPSETDGPGNGWRNTVANRMPRIASITGAIAAVLVAGWVLVGDLKPDEAVVGVLVGLAALILVVLGLTSSKRLAPLLDRINGVTLGNVVGLQFNDAYAKLAANQSSDSFPEDEPTNAETLLDLKVSLENKLTYLANNIINADKGSDPIPGYLTIGSLKKSDELLNSDEVRIAYDILGKQFSDYDGLSAVDRETFLKGASRFVDLLRINVFANLIEKRLESRGWRLSRLPGELRDILVSPRRDDPTAHHVVPAIARRDTTYVYRRAKARLETTSVAAGEAGRRFIVVPPTFKEKQDNQLLANASDPIPDNIWSVTLYALLQWLGDAPRRTT
jgi:hypothetical protein